MKRILTIHRGSIGDFLLLLPSLAILRTHYPDARIEMLGRTEILSLGCPGIADAIDSIERASLVSFFESTGGLPEDEARYFSSFDTVLAFLSDPQRIFEGNLNRLGIERFVVRPPFPPENAQTHVARYLYETIVPLLGRHPALAESSEPSRLLYPEEEEIRQAEAFLKLGHCAKTPLIAIHPGSGSEKKCWPLDRFEALARKLVEEDCELLLILGPADERLVERMTTLAVELGCSIANSPPLRQLAALLAKCDAYVGNDSGVTHLAAATGIPTLAIFGPTDPAVWAPLGSHVKVITSDVECSPCTRQIMHQCYEQICLERISIEGLASALKNLESNHSS